LKNFAGEIFVNKG